MNLKEYWNRKIIDWEKSAYQGVSKELSLIEKIATRFREPIKKRKEILLSILKDLIKGKRVLELGCGSGGLCFELLGLGASKVIGIDITEESIKVAKQRCVSLGFQKKMDFFVADVRDDVNLPDADFVVGLGFIDYIDIDSLKKLLAKVKGRFIFSFLEKKVNLINFLHYIYLKSQGCPCFYKFSRKEFDNVLGISGRCHFFDKDNMTFIANFYPRDF